MKPHIFFSTSPIRLTKDKHSAHHPQEWTTADSVNIPRVQSSIPSLRGNHRSCCTLTGAVYMFQAPALPSSPTLPALPAQMVSEEFPNWPCHRGAKSRKPAAGLWLTRKQHRFPSRKLPGDACAWRSISEGQDGDEGIVPSLDLGPKTHWSSRLSLSSCSRLEEMLSTAAAEEQWKGPSWLALQHRAHSSVSWPGYWAKNVLIYLRVNDQRLSLVSHFFHGILTLFWTKKGVGVIFLRLFFPVGYDKSHAVLLSVLTHKTSSNIWHEVAWVMSGQKYFRQFLGK